MNIFENVNAIIGDAPEEQLRQSSMEFWQHTSTIRKQLGKRSYLLDKYLSILFESANNTTAADASDAGFNSVSEQQSLLKGILEGRTDSQCHPLYAQAKAYINSHPLPYQELNTRIAVYSVGLEDDIFSYVASSYFKKEVDTLRYVFDHPNLNALYQSICDLLDNAEDMDKLNNLFKDRFMAVSNMISFIQGFTNDLMYILITRDIETNRQIFQLVLDGME